MLALIFIWTFIFPTAAKILSVTLSPNLPVWRVGDRQILKCSVQGCPEGASFRWTRPEDQPLYAEPRSNTFYSELIFNNVSLQHDYQIGCRVTCKGTTDRKEKHAPITVYSLPNDPVISGTLQLRENKRQNLTCDVTDAYVPRSVLITWSVGHTVLSQTEIISGPISSTYTITPTVEDHGKNITCRATILNLGVPEEQRSKESTQTLNVFYEPKDVKISNTTTVFIGESFTLTCEAAGNPEPKVQWRKLEWSRQGLAEQGQEHLVVGSATLSHTGEYECVVSNSVGTKTARVAVIVQAPPRNTSIIVRPAGELKEGDNVTISCVSDAVPAGRVVLRRVYEGQRTDLISSSRSHTSVTLPSATLANSGLYECEASNQYGSQNVSTVVHITVFLIEVALSPGDGVITVQRGSSVTLSCSATGCPAPEFFWKSRLDGAIRGHQKTQGSLSELFLDQAVLLDDQAYTCEVHCGSVWKAKHTEIKVFSFPTDPVIVAVNSAMKDTPLKLHCIVHDVFPAGRLQFQWFHEDGRLLLDDSSVRDHFHSGLQNVTSVLSFTPETKDHGKWISCRVTLSIETLPKNQKSATTTINLVSPPRNISITVRPAGELKEGDNVTISCISDAVPAGRVVLRRVCEGQRTNLISSSGSHTFITLNSAVLADSGQYECEASNQYGTQKSTVQVQVRAPPRNTTVEVFPSLEVQEGQNITICCKTISFPPPVVILRKLDGDKELNSTNGTFLLQNVTATDTGLYQVNVSNTLGYEMEEFIINVKGKPTSPLTRWYGIVIPAVGLVSTLVALNLIIYHLRKSRMNGSYELAMSSPGTA